VPDNLEAHFVGVPGFLEVAPSAEVLAQLRGLLISHAQLMPDLDAAETAHVEVICERLRLLYVRITRTRRNLFISRSQAGLVMTATWRPGPAQPCRCCIDPWKPTSPADRARCRMAAVTMSRTSTAQRLQNLSDCPRRFRRATYGRYHGRRCRCRGTRRRRANAAGGSAL